MKLVLLFLTCFACTVQLSIAQGAGRTRGMEASTPQVSPFESQNMPLLIGLSAGFDFSQHSGALVMQDTGSGGSYTTVDGNGTGIRGGLQSFIPLMQGLYLKGGLGLEGRGGILSSSEEKRPITGEDAKLHDATINHSMDISMRCADVDLMLAPIISRTPLLYVCGGISASLPLQKRYFSYEQIISPSSLNYQDGYPTRNMSEGDLQNVRGAIVSAKAGFGALFVLRKFLLNMEFVVSAPLQPYTTDASKWTSTSYMLNLGLFKAY